MDTEGNAFCNKNSFSTFFSGVCIDRASIKCCKMTAHARVIKTQRALVPFKLCEHQCRQDGAGKWNESSRMHGKEKK